MALQHLRSSTANKRPLPAGMSDGQLAINTNLASPGLFFKDSNGDLVKVGPVHVGTTAPNASPASGGQTGNTLGEQWLDTTGGTYVFKVWDGSAWRSESGTFVDVNGDVMTGALGIIAGTAGSPGLYISGDTNTGIYSPGADQVSVATGGTERLRIDSNGQIEAVSLGTAAAPVFSFTGDPNTGIYSPGADQLAISTGGSGRLFVDASGNVGINYSTPSNFASGDLGATAPVVIGDGTATRNLTLFGANNSYGSVAFADSTTGSAKYAGLIQYYHADNSLQFYTNSTERLRITSAGLVGIGTSSPDAKLEVVDTASSLTYPIAVSNFTDPAANVGAAVDFRLTTGGNSRGYIACQYTDNTSAGGTYLSFAPNDGSTGNVERMRITKTGLVGIGSNAPTKSLEVAAGNTSGNGILVTGSNSPRILLTETNGNVTNWIAVDASAAYAGTISNHPYNIYTNSLERCRVDTSGRLLVGTSSYSGGVRAVFRGNTAATGVDGVIVLQRDSANPSTTQGLGSIRFVDSNNGLGADISALGDGSWNSPSDCPTKLVFSTTADGASSPTERMRITSSGQSQFFCNTGNIATAAFQSNATSGQQYGINITTANDQNDATRTFVECFGSATLRAAIRSNGGLANYSANNANLSDRNAKKDISPAANTWDCIKEWEIVNYRYKDQPDDADLNLGVIAQQVAESCPEVVTVFEEAKDDQPEKLGIKEQQMYWMAIKALQEAQVRIEALEAEVTALKAQ